MNNETNEHVTKVKFQFNNDGGKMVTTKMHFLKPCLSVSSYRAKYAKNCRNFTEAGKLLNLASGRIIQNDMNDKV